ncbi:MAG: redox-sensing transcriptional repressor Rex [Actinomycetota bacterium]
MHKLLQSRRPSYPPRDEEARSPVPVRPIPEATVARLPVYLRVLLEMAERGLKTVSSNGLAEATGVNPAKVRKDLSYLGTYGTRGVGYDVEYLTFQVRRVLGLEQIWPVAIVGAGNLGRALANHKGFAERGLRIVALLDSNSRRIGQKVGGLLIEPVEELDRVVKEREVAIAVIATPASVAQEIAERLVGAGVTSLLNFAPTLINVPAGVSVRSVDLAVELQILSYYEERRTAGRS